MTEFEKAKAEIKETYKFLNSIYNESFEPPIREVDTWKFPVAVNNHGAELILIPKFFAQCSVDCKKACVGMSYGWLYMHKHCCEIKDGEYYITGNPHEIITSIWDKLNISFQCEKMTFYNMLETLLRPVRRSYFTDIKDKSLLDIGFEFRSCHTTRRVTDIFADGDDIMIEHECIAPEDIRQNSKRYVEKEEDLIRLAL